MSRGTSRKTKRQEMRERHRRKQRQQRLIVIGVIVAVAALIVVWLVVPAVLEANAPVGEFVQITPMPRPNPDGTAMGDPNAPATIEVFEDFKCSACAGFHFQIEPVLVTDLVETGKAYYVFRQYPFLDDRTNVKDSDSAANASMCAAEENRFWDYKDILFTNFSGTPGEYGNNRLVAFADSLGLNVGEFENCLDSKRYQDEVDSDIALGVERGVTGTPTVFVNGVKVQGPQPNSVPTVDEIKAAVEAASNP